MRTAVWRRVIGSYGSLEEGLTILDKETHSDDIVLPEAPTDEEKYSYMNTRRTFIVGYGMFSAILLSVGMWFFVFSSLDFLWFSVPAAFISFYLLVSYFGIAVFGKDFDLQKHERIIAKAEIENKWPTVDIYLPSCGEDLKILQNTYEHVSKLQYPHDKLHVFVLDDSGKKMVEHLAHSFNFGYIDRPEKTDKKAGNLRYAFARTSAEFLLILDADFCPRPDFLVETIPYFNVDPNIAIVQTPQFFKWREQQTWVERAAGVSQEIFYRLVQTNRQAHKAAICVGTCGVYRRASLEPFGGTALISFSEDLHTSFMITNAGLRVEYIPLNLAEGTCPDTCRAAFSQTYRWAMGSTTLCSNKEFWNSNLTFYQKMAYSTGFMYYIATAMSLFMSSLPAILLIYFRPNLVFWFNSLFALPSLLMPFWALRSWCTQPYRLECIRFKTLQYLAHLFALIDLFSKSQIAWVPTGVASASKSKSRYPRAMRLIMNWSLIQLILLWAGAAWRMQTYPAFNFIPSLVLETFNVWVQLSIFYE
jgi:hypothetical protein